jgi:hypothetical protein
METEAIYARLLARIQEERASLLHPEYPAALVARRFPLLRKTPLYYSGNYVSQMRADPGAFTVRFGICIGKSRLRELASHFSLAERLAVPLGLPISPREAYNRFTIDIYRPLTRVIGEGSYFLVHNPAANDELDAFEPERTLRDPFWSAAVDGLGFVRVEPWWTTVHVQERRDPLPPLLRLIETNQALRISASHELAEALYRFLAANQHLLVGAPEAYWNCEAKVHHSAAVSALGRSRLSDMRLLVDGQLYDLPLFPGAEQEVAVAPGKAPQPLAWCRPAAIEEEFRAYQRAHLKPHLGQSVDRRLIDGVERSLRERPELFAGMRALCIGDGEAVSLCLRASGVDDVLVLDVDEELCRYYRESGVRALAADTRFVRDSVLGSFDLVTSYELAPEQDACILETVYANLKPYGTYFTYVTNDEAARPLRERFLALLRRLFVVTDILEEGPSSVLRAVKLPESERGSR